MEQKKNEGLPEGWEIGKLWDPDVAKLIMGQSPDSKSYNSRNEWLPFYQGKKEFWELYPIAETWCTEPKKIAGAWDVLLSVRAPVGPTNICQEKSCIGRWLWAVRANPKRLNGMFLLHFFRAFESKLAEYWKWSTFPAITKKELENFEIPLPPLTEQQRIVAKLDGIFEHVDSSIQLLERNLADIDAMAASVLNEMFKHEGLPDGWKLAKMKNLSDRIQYGYTGKTVICSPFRYLRITDIQNGAVNWNSVPFSDIQAADADKYLLKPGDLVFARTWATLGKSYLVTTSDEGNIFASYLIRLSPRSSILNSRFLAHFFQSELYWGQIYADAVWAAQPNFNGSKLSEIEIPLPPLAEQERIVAKLDAFFIEQKAAKTKYESQITELKALKSSILSSAFRGEI